MIGVRGLAIAIIAIVGPWGEAARGQTPTYQDQVSYYGEDDSTIVSFAIPPDYASLPSVYADNVADFYSPSGQVSQVVYIGDYGGVSMQGSGGDDTFSFMRITDDVNENGVPGAAVVMVPGPDGNLMPTTLTDFSDLHQFNIAFDQLSVAHQAGYRLHDAGGVYWIYEEENEEENVRGNAEQVAAKEAAQAIANQQLQPTSVRRGSGSRVIYMRSSTRSGFVPHYSKYEGSRRGAGVGLTYGYNEFGVFHRFYFEGNGGILGRTWSDTRADNWVTGPQAGIVAFKSFGPLKLYAHGIAVAGMNDGDMVQNNGIGAELVPGATSRLLYAQPTYSEHRAAFDEFTPAGMLWAEAGLQVTENSTLRVAWSGVFIDNVILAQDRIRFYLPDMGFRDPGNQNFIQQLFFCGIEVVR